MTSRFARFTALSLALLTFIACGGSGSSSDDGDGGGPAQEGGALDDAGGDPDAASVNGGASYTVSGTLTGLGAGQSITITDNAADPLTLHADGAFTFAKKVAYSKSYSVTITTTPENQDCSVQQAAGTVTKAVTNVAVTCTTITPKMFLVAGKPGAAGTADGTGPTARFTLPSALTVDATGNVYVADTGNDTIRKISPAGVVTTLAGTAGASGSGDGTGAAARFTQPSGIAVDGTGTVFVSDTGNFTIRSITAAGAVTTIAGMAGQSGNVNASGSGARFAKPLGLFTKDGFLFIADRDNAAIRQLTIGGASPPVVTYQSGITTPVGVTFDAMSSKYAEVSDFGQIVFEIGGSTLAGTAATPGFVNAIGTAARFHDPSAVAYSGGLMYVADPTNNVIRSINVTTGAVNTFAGTGVAGALDSFNGQALFNGPKGVAVDAAGAVYVADTGNHVIRKIAGGMVSTFAGSLPSPGSVDGVTGTASRFSSPFGVATDSGGNVFVADSGNHTIRKIVPGGAVTTFAGQVGAPGNMNGTGTGASFNQPSSIAVDKADNLYVSDQGNCLIRKITKAAVVTTLADSGGCPAAMGDALVKWLPQGITVDSMGNVFFVDIFGYSYAVWKVTPAGAATPFVGGTQGNGDGKGLGAWFNFPTHIAIDASDDMFVADTGNSLVRKVTPAGDVTTVSFASTPALASPTGIVVDRTGTLFVTDVLRGLVFSRTSAGAVTTVLGVPNQLGLAVGALPGNFNAPANVAIFGTSLFVVDSTENAVVQVTNLVY